MRRILFFVAKALWLETYLPILLKSKLATKATNKSAATQIINEMYPKIAKTVNSNRSAMATAPTALFLCRTLSVIKPLTPSILKQHRSFFLIFVKSMRIPTLVTVFSKVSAVIGGVCDDNCTFKSKGNWVNWFFKR
jgi:hypothetical protein